MKMVSVKIDISLAHDSKRNASTLKKPKDLLHIFEGCCLVGTLDII